MVEPPEIEIRPSPWITYVLSSGRPAVISQALQEVRQHIFRRHILPIRVGHRAMTAKVWRKERGVGLTPPGPGGSPACFTAVSNADRTASTESRFLRNDTNTWSSKGT